MTTPERLFGYDIVEADSATQWGIGFRIQQVGSLAVSVDAGRVRTSATTSVSVVSQSSLAVTPSATTYIFVDSTGTLTTNTTGYPRNTLALIGRVVSEYLSITSITADLTPYQLPTGSQLEFLLDCEPDSTGVTYSVTRTGGRVSQETWTDTATSKTLKTISYARIGNLVSSIQTKVYAVDGVTVAAQTTETLSRSSGVVSGSTKTRDI